jgi:zinc protease
MMLLGQVRPHSPSVDVRIRLATGAARDPADLTGLASFTGRGMQRGTEAHTFDELNAISDSLGASIGIDAGRFSTDLAIRCLVEDLPVMIGLAAEIIRRPIFPEAEIEKVRGQILSGIREADNDTGSRATRAFRQLIFPPPHPYGNRVAGELDTVARITPADLAQFHAAQFGPAGAVVAIVGGVDSFAAASDLIADSFADWDGGAIPSQDIAFPAPPAARTEARIAIPGKRQADIVLGVPAIARTDPAYYALDMANLILGRLGLMGRLGASVRDHQGLAYYASSQIEPGLDGSLWLSRAGVDPVNIDRAIDGIIAELRKIRDEPISTEELSDAQSYLIGILPIALEANGGVAATLLNIHRYGLGLDYIQRYPSIVRALNQQDVLDVVRATLDPDFVAIGIAGPPAIIA